MVRILLIEVLKKLDQAQFFHRRFGNMILRPCISSCTQLLERRGDMPMISEPAATTTPAIASCSVVIQKEQTPQARALLPVWLTAAPSGSVVQKPRGGLT